MFSSVRSGYECSAVSRGEQRHVFYINRILLEAETCYSAVEKMVLALVNAKKKLCHYFETHPITVTTEFPIKQILSKPDLSRRLTKWAIDLGIYGIRYVPRAAKKGQVMVDFLVEVQSFLVKPEQLLRTEEEFQMWILSIDGVSNSIDAGIGIMLKAPSGLKIEEARRLSFQTTNNEVEYEALIYYGETPWSKVTQGQIRLKDYYRASHWEV